MTWVVVLGLLVALALAAFVLGGRLFAGALDGRTPDELPPGGGCCGFNLPGSGK